MRDRNAPLSAADVDGLAWDKMDGLLPAVVQDAAHRPRADARLHEPRERWTRRSSEGCATFYSRSQAAAVAEGRNQRQSSWRSSAVLADCDGDALLVQCDPAGPTCHLGTASCFGGRAPTGPALARRTVGDRAQRAARTTAASYTRQLLAEGVPGIAQKIGEEGVELALAAVIRDPARLRRGDGGPALSPDGADAGARLRLGRGRRSLARPAPALAAEQAVGAPPATFLDKAGPVGGGAGGIRTLDTLLAYTHFPGERLRPLGHRSACSGRRTL